LAFLIDKTTEVIANDFEINRGILHERSDEGLKEILVILEADAELAPSPHIDLHVVFGIDDFDRIACAPK